MKTVKGSTIEVLALETETVRFKCCHLIARHQTKSKKSLKCSPFSNRKIPGPNSLFVLYAIYLKNTHNGFAQPTNGTILCYLKLLLNKWIKFGKLLYSADKSPTRTQYILMPSRLWEL